MKTLRLVQNACDIAQSMVARGMPRREILTYLITAAEKIAPTGCVASILVLDAEGLLRNGSSPSLPPDYLDAIDRLKPHPQVGTCSAAAATGEVVVTPDFTADEKWSELRHLPLALGYTGAWSTPIKDPEGRVLGTFGIYCRERANPSAEDRAAMSALAAAAAGAIAKAR